VARGAAISPSDPVRVLRPQLGDAVLGGEILGVLGRVAQARAAVAAVGGELLVFVLGDEAPTRVGVDRLAAFAQLLRDRAALVLGALGRVDDAGMAREFSI
jgi:hypothetical protein